VLHAIARHRSCPENLGDFRMIILNRQLSVDGKQDSYYSFNSYRTRGLTANQRLSDLARDSYADILFVFFVYRFMSLSPFRRYELNELYELSTQRIDYKRFLCSATAYPVTN
jgi:hypothetical protein